MAGCASAPPAPLKSLRVGAAAEAATATVHKTAALTYMSGTVDGNLAPPTVVSGNVLYAWPADQAATLFFNLQDQADTAEALHASMVSQKVFDAVELSSAPRSQPDLKITVVFSRTHYDAGLQQYTLEALMHIDGGKQRFSKQYRAQSNPQGSLFTAARLTSDEAKAEAARALLGQWVADIRGYAAGSV